MTSPTAATAHVIRQFPHCDSRMLHAPLECEYCDAHPDWQELRQMWAIAFSGHAPVGGERECPFDVARPGGSTWGGNQPVPLSSIVAALTAAQAARYTLTEAERAELLTWAKDVLDEAG